mmetsp:Transcript_23826/g.58423  ORF Transcript_23826/g.58423 Transcript_23826/m.58423 type:complete len:349 (+) Transcript_23826:212-1258(+)
MYPGVPSAPPDAVTIVRPACDPPPPVGTYMARPQSMSFGERSAARHTFAALTSRWKHRTPDPPQCRKLRALARPSAIRTRTRQVSSRARVSSSSAWSRAPFSASSYTRHGGAPPPSAAGGVYPSSRTTCGHCLKRLSTSISRWAERSVASPPLDSCFTANTRPLLASTPRYTTPNAPSPSFRSAENPSVHSSRYARDTPAGWALSSLREASRAAREASCKAGACADIVGKVSGLLSSCKDYVLSHTGWSMDGRCGSLHVRRGCLSLSVSVSARVRSSLPLRSRLGGSERAGGGGAQAGRAAAAARRAAARGAQLRLNVVVRSAGAAGECQLPGSTGVCKWHFGFGNRT